MDPDFSGGSKILRPVKWYKKLKNSKGRLEAGAFLVEGGRSLSLLKQNFPGEIIEYIVQEGREYPGLNRGIPLRVVSDKNLREISSLKTPQDEIGVVRLPDGVYSSDIPENTGRKVLFLQDVQDPGNVGTLIRSAAAFDFDGVLLSEGCADPFSPRSVGASAGSILSLWIRKSGKWEDGLQRMIMNGFSVIAADIKGDTELSLSLIKKKIILALGNEGNGLTSDMISRADCLYRIPYNDKGVESLNVAASGAIAMFLTYEGAGECFKR